MKIELNFKSGKPAYVQIVEQIKYAAASGLLQPGEALPGIRPLSERLCVNRNTVLRAYSELENEGVVEKITGVGCIITENSSPLKKSVRTQLLTEAINAALVQAYQMRVTEDEFLTLAKKRAQAFYASESAPNKDQT